MIDRTFGRFTARGGAAVEAEIADVVRRAGELVARRVPRRALRALLLVGGYGRGEGGVERRGGVERPHNNLDFMLVTRGLGRAAAQKRLLDDLFRPLAEASGVGIDAGVIGELRLRAAPCLVRWYDMRFGHKTVVGDAGFASSLMRFRVEAIEPADVRDLLVNRGSLLVLNDRLARTGALAEPARRALVRHAMKAILGYGDACLFALGDYHVSYAERQRRMRHARALPERFRALYDEASEFRFEPSYDRFTDRDLLAWSSGLTAELEPLHLFFEAWRLRVPGLRWNDYAEHAIRGEIRDRRRSALLLARAARDLLRAPGGSGLGFFRDVALRAAGPKARLAIALPAVLYGAGVLDHAELARRVLLAGGASRADLRRAYVDRWGEHGDTNLGTTAHGLRQHPGLLEATG